MQLKLYLAESEFINYNHPSVMKKAEELYEKNDEFKTAENCFLFVRDEIKHSWDFKLNPVTIKASDVLQEKTGYCYAKSHLLAALLRANEIPAALCYQRLSLEDYNPFCLHGLNALYLKEFGWYRVDPRGNKEGVHAAFDPPFEKLAFLAEKPGEATLPELWPEPLCIVIHSLRQYDNYLDVRKNLPDIELFSKMMKRG